MIIILSYRVLDYNISKPRSRLNLQIDIIQLNMLLKSKKGMLLANALLLQSLVFQVPCYGCSTTYYTNSSCKILYNRCDDDGSGYANCQKMKCDDQGSCRVVKQLSDVTCLAQCCDQKQARFSLERLLKCKIDYKEQTIAFPNWAIPVLIVASLIFVVCIYNIIRCQSQRASVARPQESMQRQITEQNIQPDNWRHDDFINPLIEDKNSTCTICLGDNVNSQAKCNHCFHISCLAEWVSRNPHCPVCRSQEIAHVKYYCLACCQQYLNVNLKTYNLSNFMDGLTCERCK